jgi:hypothetical protein
MKVSRAVIRIPGSPSMLGDESLLNERECSKSFEKLSAVNEEHGLQSLNRQ